MYGWFDKLMHFAVGLAVGGGFWWLLERYGRDGIRRINPILFLVFLIWGASGLFFFRLLHVPVLSGQLFYMAIPDWDIPLSQWTRWSFLMHRSWLFHSAILPIAILFGSLWQLQTERSRFWRWVRDGAMGLSVGMCAHVLWDAILSSTKRGFVIRGWNSSTSLAWLGLNLVVGIGIPLAIVWLMRSDEEIEI